MKVNSRVEQDEFTIGMQNFLVLHNHGYFVVLAPHRDAAIAYCVRAQKEKAPFDIRPANNAEIQEARKTGGRFVTAPLDMMTF